MTAHPIPHQDLLNQRIRYEPETGKLFWKRWNGGPKEFNTRFEGKEAFRNRTPEGYLFGRITLYTDEGVRAYRVYAHRAIWKMAYAADPDFVDHINGIRSDNRLENLRDVSRVENAINKRLRSDNKSGHHGVWQTQHGSWRAFIGMNGRATLLGTYKTKSEALRVRRAAEKALGFHKNHGDSRLRVA